MSCGNSYTSNNLPSYDVLCKIYSQSSSVFIEVDSKNVIHSVSPAVTKQYGYEPSEMIGHYNDDFVEVVEGELYRKTKAGDSVRVLQEKLGDSIVIEQVMTI